MISKTANTLRQNLRRLRRFEQLANKTTRYRQQRVCAPMNGFISRCDDKRVGSMADYEGGGVLAEEVTQ